LTVGTTMVHWKQWDSPVCPLCHLENKSTLHVLQCLELHHMAKWHQLIMEFKLWLVWLDAHPDMTWCLTTTLDGWGLLPFSSANCPSCSLATQEQELISFLGFSIGHLSSQWESIQAGYWRAQGSQKSSKYWARCLCQWLVQITHDIWVFWNQQIQSQLSETHIWDMGASIQHKFDIGLQDLLPADFLYVSLSPHLAAFLLPQVLALPLQDQELWLHALQQVCAQGFHVTQAELAQMRTSLNTWLHPSPLVQPDYMSVLFVLWPCLF